MTNRDLDDVTAIQALIAALPSPTLIIGRAEKVVALNGAAEMILGKNVVERHFTTGLRNPKLVDAVERSLLDHTTRKVSYQSLVNGSEAFFDVHLQIIPNTDLLLLSYQNVTDLAQGEQMRREFVANVSHELRTPLTALMGFIETLRGPAKDDAKARERFLAIMAREAGRMNRLVGDLLSLSRVEADEHVRPTAAIDLILVLQATINNLDPLARDNKVTIAFDPQQGPLHVIGDADQMLQVFTNLLGNAIKYGAVGQTVEIAAQTHDHDPVLRGPAIAITFRDHGPGIDPIHLPRLTERFYRADSHRSRDLGGTGLGLAIVKHIINRHRGRLKISSQLGQGSQFTVFLPPAARDDKK